MELHSPFSTLIMATLIFLFVFLFKLFSQNSIPKLPPGPPTLPLIGNIHQLIIGSSSSTLHNFLRNLAQKYGPLMHLKLGEVSHIVVSSPEIAEQILKTHDLNFCNRPDLVSSRIMSYNNINVGFAAYGDYWRQLRKICTSELLSTNRVQSFRSIREEEVSALVRTISASEGFIFNLSHHLYSLTFGIITRATVGKKSRHQQVLVSAIEEQLKLMGFAAIFVSDLYPSCGKVLQMSSWGKAKAEKLHQKIDRILQDIIEDRRNNNNKNETDAAEEHDDLLQVLLKFQKDSEIPFTDDTIKAIIQDMFMAGSETPTLVMEWGMSQMIKNPKVMEKAQAEVRRVFNSKGYADETELHKLIYLKSVIKEIMRLYPVMPLTLRENRERCEIYGYEIPSRSRVIMNIWAIERDPKYWAEAESFKPERFLDSTVDYRGMDFEFIPFGAGRRMCPGIAFCHTLHGTATCNIALPL